MRCSQCGFLNPDSALVCAECGAAAAGDARPEPMADQEAVRRLRRYIPSVVAEGILRDQGRLRGERREVTILFADAVNFTRLSESLDAESIFNLINDLLSRLMECVHRYDGVVDKFTGDGMMVVFGAPLAHENDPELAVWAALDMQQAAAGFEPVARAQLGAPLQIRLGIHCGPAVAGIIGTQTQAAYTVIGETVNLAARLQSLARPGHTLVSERVYQQTQALFNFQSMGAAQVKGISQPVAVYELIGDRSEPVQARRGPGFAEAFLGRDAELGQLQAFLTAFLDERRGRLVVIQGEAGIGKSRLVAEGLSGLPSGQVAILQARGLPYAQGVVYGIFRSLLQEALRTLSAGPAWDALVPQPLRPFLWQILGQALAPEQQAALRNLEPERVKQLTALALREWLLGEAHRQPLVLVMEDFQWADGLSRDALQSLVNPPQQAPLFVLIVTRPQPELHLDLPRASLEEPPGVPLSLFLDLQPLSPQDSRMLLGHMVNLASLPEQFVDTLLARARGTPFYIEEFVRMLTEKQVLRLEDGQWQVPSAMVLQALEIPSTVRGLIMARMDRLPEDLQRVLRTAAVVGSQFAVTLLGEIERRLHGTANVLPLLDRLTDLGLLEERPQAGEQVLGFRNILTQETIYSSLLRSQRPDLHRVVAECIEELYAAGLSDQAEVLALHYVRARVHDKTMHYALLAGDRARARFANQEAIEYYSQALQSSQHLGGQEAQRWRAAVGMGEVEQHTGKYEEAAVLYRAALDEWKQAPVEARAQAMLRLGQVGDKRGDLDEAEDWLRQGLAQLGDAYGASPDLRAEIYSELGWISLRRGDLAAAHTWLEQGLTLVSHTQHYAVLSSILNRLGAVHYHRGEWSQAAGCVERALELRERLGDIVGYARSLNNLGILKQASGDWAGALSCYERAVESHERIGEVEGLALAHTNLGVLYTIRGEWAKAEENLLRSFALAQGIAHPYELAQAHMNVGRLYLLQERWAECARHLDAAIPLYTEAGAQANLNLSDTYWLQGLLRLEQGQTDVALEWAGRSHKLLREVTGADEGESVEWGRYEQLAGRIAQARSDLVVAQHHLERSAAIFRASGSQQEAGQTAYWMALLWLALQQPDRARQELLAARQTFERLGAVADLQRVEEQLARLKQP
ncbi:MAG: tetratricopeptide repeat protein [Thermoflexales bacterium]|nr:tetratricopeptide repeat protein [Thermoflexales bacterium]